MAEARRLRPADNLIRSVCASFAAAARDDGAPPIVHCRRLFPDDRVTPELMTRAATGPATTFTTGWASQLSPSSAADFLGTMGAAAGSSALFKNALRLDTRRTLVNIPAIPSNAGLAAWVQENAPIPVMQAPVGTAQLAAPFKLCAFVAATRELSEHAVASFESIMGQVLRESFGKAVDASIFSATAASAARPAGLLVGASAITPTAGGGANAAFGDIRLLADAIVAAGGGSNIMFFCSPGRALSFSMLFDTSNFQMIPTPGIAAATIIAVEASGLVISAGDTIEVTNTTEATLHLEDTAPAQIGTTGSPNVVAAPTRSLWQTDSIALRVILRLSWAMRATGLVQFINAATW